jgi:putative flippase GtrA
MNWPNSMPTSSSPLWLRFLAIGVGILILLWLPIEDTSEIPAITIALIICGLLALRFLFGDQSQPSFIRMTFLSALAGIAIIPMSLFLIAFKSGIHSHDTPEFPVEQIMAVLQRTPYFAIGGLLIGLGSSVWLISKKKNNNSLSNK